MLNKLNIVLLCIIVASFIGSYGCQRKRKPSAADSSTRILKLDTGKVETALRNFSALPPGTRGKAKILEAIRDSAAAMGYNEQACYLSMDLARGQSDRGNLDSALYYYNYARPFCNEPLFDKTMPAHYLTEFSSFYHSLRSDFVAANKSYYDALNYLKENNLAEIELAIALYISLHGTQIKLGNEEQAYVYLQEAESLAKKLDSKQGLAATWAHMGDYYSHKKDYPAAIKYYDMAIEYEENIWDPNILLTALLGKAQVLTHTEVPAKAIPVLEKAIDVAQKEVVIYNVVAATIELGNVYNKLGRYHETIKTVTPALKNKSREVNTVQAKGYQVLMEAYEGLGDYKRALEQQRILYAWQDSLFNVEKASALNELELKFQTASKDKEIASNELLIEQQENRLTRNNILIVFISTVAFFILAIVIGLYKNAVNKKKVSELQLKTLQRQQEIDLLKSAMEGEEQERQRLARELHDGIGSMISSAIMRLSLLEKQEKGLDHAENYSDVLRLLQDTGSEIRKTAHNMMPDTIYKQSIAEAVKTYCESISKGTVLDIDVQFYGIEGEFTSHCKLVIYRIIQELVHNIVKHAKATQAIVQGVSKEDRFEITVEDNGKGFDITAEKSGIGLKNVAARVKSLGGDFQVESVPGKGTTVYIEFDCKEIMKNDNPKS